MTIEREFERLYQGWKKHYAAHTHCSSIHAYINCDAYRTLVDIGEPILPFALARAEEDGPFELCLGVFVNDILGDRFDKTNIHTVDGHREYTIGWLKEYLAE